MPSVVTDATFSVEVLQEKDKYVLVDFWAEWCGPCRMLAPVLENVAKAYESRVKVMKLDTDANPVTSQEYKIMSIPCCVLFKDGQEVAKLIGFKPEAQFKAELEKLLV